MDQREILFGKRITRLRREIAELESDLLVLAGLHTYSPTMDQYDVRACVRDLNGACEAARNIQIKLESINRS